MWQRQQCQWCGAAADMGRVKPEAHSDFCIDRYAFRYLDTTLKIQNSAEDNNMMIMITQMLVKITCTNMEGKW